MTTTQEDRGALAHASYNRGQKAALADLVEWWYDNDSRPWYLSSKAGTGKTTIANGVADALELDGLACLAPTGKAASLLRGKVKADWHGTIHSALYRVGVQGSQDDYDKLCDEIANERSVKRARELRTRLTEMFRPRWTLQDDFVWARGADGQKLPAIVVDEASMVNSQLGSELAAVARKRGVRLVVFGDRNQLPPVEGQAFFGPRNCAMAPELTRVMRQGEGSFILDVADLALDGERIRPGSYDDNAVQVLARIKRREVADFDADMIVCGRHTTRLDVIEELRHGLPALPQVGERMQLWRNLPEFGVYNGELFTIDMIETGKVGAPMDIRADFGDGRIAWITAALAPDGAFEKGAEHSRQRWMSGSAVPIAFGHAMTCHKAQGSEWSHVLVIDEKYCFGQASASWLYTAVTRARDELTIASRLA